MRLRAATAADRDQLLQWRQQDEQAPWWQGDHTTISQHIQWLGARLDNPAVGLWILENDLGLPVGQARVDSNGEISFSIDQHRRGQGYGTQIVQLATWAATNNLGHTRLKANVDDSNQQGIRTLLAAGYVLRPDVLFARWPE